MLLLYLSLSLKTRVDLNLNQRARMTETKYLSEDLKAIFRKGGIDVYFQFVCVCVCLFWSSSSGVGVVRPFAFYSMRCHVGGS